ncbi:hypothetical protein AMS57_02170 [Pseudoalteromonas undina]|uniref:hypothetical protein n=1 Tax=Pseudoalteromonas undina TaxID=43660 RepID=UPI0006BA74D0|nr:hypothetical protein [Pseudoalteromonas undina]KPH92351.1 hypothetical protein AMS57_02170 [Pseudoalteromonas undina]
MGSVSSSAAHSPDSQQSQGLDGREQTESYSELDSFINGDDSETGSETTETESEEMSEQDAAIAAGFFVDTGAGFVESLFDYPVTIDNDTKQVIAEKAVPVVLKNAKGMQLPPWLIRYKEELELIGVIAMAGLSIHKQIKAAKAEELNAQKSEQKSEKQYDKSGEVTIGY